MINLHCFNSVVTGTLTTSSSTVNSLLLTNGLCLVSQLLLGQGLAGQGLAEPGDRGEISDSNSFCAADAYTRGFAWCCLAGAAYTRRFVNDDTMVFRGHQLNGTALQTADTIVHGTICHGGIGGAHTGSSVRRSHRSCQFTS